MAKAKKSSSPAPAAKAQAAATDPTAEKKPAAKKPAASKKAAPTAAGTAPSIDTSAAASAAASLVANRVAPQPTGEAKPQSAAFKQFKDNVNKPAAGNLGGLFGNVGNQKKSNQPFGGPNQRGHSQRFGADVNRSGLPRRTGG